MAINRNYTLDVLRAVLAWSVVLVHIAWVSGIQGETQRVAGEIAVEGFIVLSGFVITQLILTKRESYGVFIFRRFMRLFPIFIVCLFFSLAIRPLTIGAIQSATNPMIEASENQFFWQHLAAHLSLLHGAVPTIWLPMGQYAFLVPAWSISLEFQLYLVAPLLVWWLSRSGLRGTLLVLIPSVVFLLPAVASTVGRIWLGSGAFLPQKFLFFLAGALIYLFSTKGPRQTTLYKYPRWLIRAGEISYSTYLVHYPILALIVRFVPFKWPAMLKMPVIGLVCFPITLGLSILLYRYVERPGIELGKRLSQEIKLTTPSTSIGEAI